MADLTFERDGQAIDAYLAVPEGQGPHAGLVLIPDVHGLSDHYRDVSRRFAAQGFATLAVDLYSREGKPALRSPQEVFAWIQALPDPRVLADIGAAVEFLRARPEVRDDAVAITGYCMGGQYALMAACTVPNLAACVSWYGMLRYAEHNERKPQSPLELAPQLGCPYLGMFGAEDAIIPRADVEELQDILSRARKDFEIEIYEGAGHAFYNDTRPDLYRPDVARRAFARAVSFLRKATACAAPR